MSSHVNKSNGELTDFVSSLFPDESVKAFIFKDFLRQCFFKIMRFFFKLPVRTRVLFGAAGVIFLFGAVLMEMIGGKYGPVRAGPLMVRMM